MLKRAVRISSQSVPALGRTTKATTSHATAVIFNQFTSNTECCSRSDYSRGTLKWQSTAQAREKKQVIATQEKQGLQASTPFIPSESRKYEFFQNVEMTSDGIAIIRFDNPNKKVNTISFKLKDEAETLWEDDIHSNSSVKGVVFTSGKADGFIAGADIFDIQSLEHKEDVIPLIQSATEFFHHLKSKGVPLVCAINGPALGGGLEWALWCDYRICTDSPKTKLGLPEVRTFVFGSFLH